MKKTFLVISERSRARGRISFYIAEIQPNVGLRHIDNDSTCSSGSNKGIINEAIAILIKNKELPEIALDYRGYANLGYTDYILIHCEGTKLVYINQFKT